MTLWQQKSLILSFSRLRFCRPTLCSGAPFTTPPEHVQEMHVQEMPGRD
jgi:hypothetical protein